MRNENRGASKRGKTYRRGIKPPEYCAAPRLTL